MEEFLYVIIEEFVWIFIIGLIIDFCRRINYFFFVRGIKVYSVVVFVCEGIK